MNAPAIIRGDARRPGAVGVGFVGCGLIAGAHLFGIDRARAAGIPIDVVACCDTDPARADAFARQSGARVLPDAAAVAGATGVDVVHVCTPTAQHRSAATLAADAGRAVFLEKPVGVDLADAAAIARHITAAGVACQVGLVLRFSPTMAELHRRLATDTDAGELITMTLRDDQEWPLGGHYGSTWRGDPSIAGAGVLIEHSIHDLDLLHWWGGDIAAVRAATRHVAGRDGIEDLAVVALEFGSGAIATLTTVWHDIAERPSNRRVEVFRRRAAYRTDDDMHGPVEITDAAGAHLRSADELDAAVLADHGAPADLADRGLPYALEIWSFYDALRSARPPSPGLDVALAAHALLDAAYASAAAGGARRTVPSGPV